MLVAEPPRFKTNDNIKGLLVTKLEKASMGWLKALGIGFIPGTIHPVRISIGFVPLSSDTCVDTYNHDGVIIILTLYVDGRLVGGGDIQLIEEIRSKLMEKFKMTYMGDVSLVVGMQITRDREKKTLTISQEEYTKAILERFGMDNCKPVGTAGIGLELSTKQPEETPLSEESRRYQAITGSVMYLAQIWRYDIMYSSGQLARAMTRPAKVHMGAAKLVLRYLAGTTDITIVCKKVGFKLTVFSDSNWGKNPDNSKSTSCYNMMMSRAPVSCESGV